MKLKDEICKNENDTANMVSEKNASKIRDHYSGMTCDGLFNATKM